MPNCIAIFLIVLFGFIRILSSNLEPSRNLSSRNLTSQLLQEYKFDANTKNLNLSHNRITYIPKNIQQLIHMEVLDLSNNPLSLSNETFQFMKYLKQLYLANCSLKVIPTLWSLNMTKLDLRYNQFINDKNLSNTIDITVSNQNAKKKLCNTVVEIIGVNCLMSRLRSIRPRIVVGHSQLNSEESRISLRHYFLPILGYLLLVKLFIALVIMGVKCINIKKNRNSVGNDPLLTSEQEPNVDEAVPSRSWVPHLQ